jgi:serine/threonine protein kinase
MADQPRMIEAWTLGEELGRGGNALVYRATRPELPDAVALKVLTTTKAQKESYRRFVQEVGFLRSLPDEPGMLPLLDAHLPSRPSANDRAWLAMPIATPIRKAVADQPLEVVVMAVGEIAATLARLAEKNVGHRDIKPGNLYWLDGRWLVGDFGLVAAPDLDELTREGKALGPAHFTAYEMIRDPVNANPLPADVFSLAKTLWALATGQEWPPLGHQSATVRGYLLSDLRPHAHADALDRLIDWSTRAQPEERPTMAEIAADLKAWHELGQSADELDVAELGARLRAKMERELAADDLLEQRRELATDHARRLQELLRPLNEALKNLHPRAEVGQQPDRYGQNMLRTYRESGAPDIVFNFGRISRIRAGRPPVPYTLVFGAGVELTSDGDLIFRTYVDIGPEGVMGSDFSWERDTASARVGSVEAERMLEEGVADLREKLREGLDVFVAHVPERESSSS